MQGLAVAATASRCGSGLYFDCAARRPSALSPWWTKRPDSRMPPKEALEKILEAFINKELRQMVHTFPDEFFKQIYPLWPCNPNS